MITIEDFYEDKLQEVLAYSEAVGELKGTSFLQNMCDILVESGDLTSNYTSSFFKKIGLEVAGYDFDEEKERLNLIVLDYRGESKISKISKDEIDTKFKRLDNFFKKSLLKLYLEIEETSECYDLAYHIYTKALKNEFKSVKMILLTDSQYSGNKKIIETSHFQEFKIDYQIIDIDYLYKVSMPNFIKRDSEIACNIPFLHANINDDNIEYESYLAILSGEQIYDIYDEFGKTILEENVRTFLQFKGKVNTGIKNTIEKNPSYFLAYNNGITATASDVILNSDKDRIIMIKNLQIVNGGQTTSSIFTAKKKHKIDITKVKVQMKLSIVRNTKEYNDFIANVARYANTQNKVNESDLFSNNIFHREYSNYSKKIWSPAVNGLQKKTKWYYERVRGEYLNERNVLTESKQKEFDLENPKKQKFDKLLLAKSENLWYRIPFDVCKGAQKSFTKFADIIVKELDKNSEMVTESYYRDTISRIILFNELEAGISKSDWYTKSFRSQILAYTISYFYDFIEKNNIIFNFKCIWDSQGLYDSLLDELLNLAHNVFKKITAPEKSGQNIGEWCKKSSCWESLKNENFALSISEDYILTPEQNDLLKKRDKKEKKEDRAIDALIEVTKITSEEWNTIYTYFCREKTITETQLSLLKKMALEGIESGFLPSDKQSKLLYSAYKQAKDEGAM